MTSTPGTPPSSADIADRLAITDILYSHCRGLDRLDSAILEACYWQDAEVDYGSYRGPAQAFAGLVVAALGEAYALTRHNIGNTLIAIEGSTAHCESYVNADHLLPGETQEMCFSGRYLDQLEKLDGQWRLSHRQVVIDWARIRDLENLRDTEAFADLAKGGQGADDPLFPFLAGGVA